MASRRYTYAGTTISVEAKTATHLIWLDEFLGPSFQATSDAPAWEISLEIDSARHEYWLSKGSTGKEITAFVQDTGVITLPLWTYSDPGRLLHDPKNNVFYRIHGRQILLLCREDTQKLRTSLMRPVREIAMGAAQQAGALLLHAAAFTIGDRALIVTGPKEAGKTSVLAYALASAGARYLTNDRLLCEASSGALHVRGLPTIVTIREGTLSLVPRIWPEVEQRRYRLRATLDECRAKDAPCARIGKNGRLELTPTQFCSASGCSSTAEAPAAILLFPRQTGSPGGLSLERLDSTQITRRLSECHFGQGRRRPVLSEAFTEMEPGTTPANISGSGTMVSDLLRALPAFDCVLGQNAFCGTRGSERLIKTLKGEN